MLDTIKAEFSTRRASYSELLTQAHAIYKHSKDLIDSEQQAKRHLLAARIKRLKKNIFTRTSENALRKIRAQNEKKRKELLQAYESTLGELKEDCFEIIFRLTQEILSEQFSVQKEMVLDKILKELESLKNQKINKIVVNASYLEVAREKIASLYKIEISNTLRPGDAVVQTDSGYLHFDWQKQLAQIKESILSEDGGC